MPASRFFGGVAGDRCGKTVANFPATNFYRMGLEVSAWLNGSKFQVVKPRNKERSQCCLSWTAPCWVGCLGFVRRSACDFVLEICVIRGQKHDRIFTTDSADHTDESQRSQKDCSIPERIHVFGCLHHAGRTNGTRNLALSS